MGKQGEDQGGWKGERKKEAEVTTGPSVVG